VIPTLEPWTEVVRSRLPAPRASDSAVERVQRAARRFPFDGLGALEIPLGQVDSAARVIDLAFHLQTPAQARSFARRVAPAHIGRFLSSWARGEHPEAGSLWLELDLDREPPARPVPGICAGLTRAVAPDWLADRLLPALRDRSLAPGARRQLLRCLAAIPAQGRLLYAASMESRQDDSVRLVVAGLDTGALAAFLGRVAPAVVARQAAGAAPLVARVARTQLSFNVGEEVGERIGIECSFPRLPARERGWTELLRRWTAAQLATADERDALLAWAGYDSAWTAAGRWPAGMETSRTFCLRCLSHLKLVCIPERPPAVKAYLLFGPLRREPRANAATLPETTIPAH
jgi:hypothetical protein